MPHPGQLCLLFLILRGSRDYVGQFTVEYIVPPKDSWFKSDMSSVQGVQFSYDGIDKDTGLRQVRGSTRPWKHTEDEVFIKYLKGEFAWNVRGQLVEGQSDEFRCT